MFGYDLLPQCHDAGWDILLGNMGILTHGKPSNRERESAHYHITDE
jgi:hypothetical protein